MPQLQPSTWQRFTAVSFGILLFLGLTYLAVPLVRAAINKPQGANTSHAGHLLRQPYADSNGLAEWLPLDGNINDASGQGANATAANFSFNGTTDGWVPGQFGQALNFDGTTDNVSFVPGAQFYNPSQLSISAWIKPSASYTATNGRIVDQSWDFAYVPSSQNLTFSQSFSSGTLTVNTSSNSVIPGVWNYLALTYDRSSPTNMPSIYINGVLQTLILFSSATGTVSYPSYGAVNIGNNSALTRGFSGVIDDVRLYNRIISQSEVTNLYQGSAPENCDQSCVAWYKLDGYGTTAATPGTLNNFTYDGTTNGWVTGKYGNALLFNGTSDYVSTAATSTFAFSNTTFTVSTWIKTSNTSQQFIAAADGTTGGWGLYTTSGVVGFEMRNGSGAYVMNGTETASGSTSGSWYLVTAVITTSTTTPASNTAALYGNGSYLGTLTGSTNNYAAPTSQTLIGRISGGSYLSGTLDDLRIYNRALSTTEITNLDTAANPDTASVDSTLVGYWPLNESGTTATTQDYSFTHAAYDSSGNQNDGYLSGFSYNGTTDGWVSGVFNNALLFNGTSDAMVVPSSSSLGFGTGDFTVEAWIKTSTTQASNYSFVVSGDNVGVVGNASRTGYSLSEQPTTGYFVISTYTSGSGGSCYPAIAYDDGKWHFMVATRHSSTLRLYVDGVQGCTSNSGTSGSITNTTPLEIGGSYGSGLAYFTGEIDDLRLYNRVLAPYEVYEQYESGMGGT